MEGPREKTMILIVIVSPGKLRRYAVHSLQRVKSLVTTRHDAKFVNTSFNVSRATSTWAFAPSLAYHSFIRHGIYLQQ